MTDEQAELYTALTRKLRDQVLADVESKGMAKSQMSILDALLKLRQICCHPRLLKVDMPGFSTGSLPSGKFEAFKDMIFDVVAATKCWSSRSSCRCCRSSAAGSS